MKTFRLIANALVAAVLIVILAGLIAIIVDDRCGKAEDSAHPKGYAQEIPFK